MSLPNSSTVATHSIDRAAFENLYAGNAPWDIDKPQPVFAAVAGRVASPVLDAGCGTGEHALFFASQGHRVTGIDFVGEAIERARAKAGERGLAVKFLVKDATTLDDLGEHFATVIDNGLFHCFSDDDRRRYVRGLAQLLEPGGRLFLMCFSDGWEVESVQAARFEINPECTEMRFSEGGPKAWFAVVSRKG